MATITSANSILTLTIPGLFNTPVQIQGFSADNIYDVADQDLAETQMGVDGKLSAGFVFNPTEQTITLMADSSSNDIFDTWSATQIQLKDILAANGSTTLPSLGKSFISTNGILVRMPKLPTAGKTLQARKFMIRWERVLAVPV